MSIPNRAALVTKLYRSLKKQYTPVKPSANRTVLEQMLFACLLEDSQYNAAEKAFTALVGAFFDWNEIRVSSVKELAEFTKELFDAEAAARRLKRTLHGVFEATYQFDLEDMRKQNIGVAEKRIEKFPGSTRFVVAYTVQHALGGHSIPLDQGSLQALYVLGIASDKEAESGKVPGLERAISKKHGIEFGSLLHQIGTEVTASPYSSKTRSMLLELAPDCKDRLPKRPSKTKLEEPLPEPPKKILVKPPPKAAEDKPAKKPVAKPVTAKAAPAKKAVAKKPVTKKRVKKPAAKKAVKKKSTTKKKTTATKRITKRKPR